MKRIIMIDQEHTEWPREQHDLHWEDETEDRVFNKAATGALIFLLIVALMAAFSFSDEANAVSPTGGADYVVSPDMQDYMERVAHQQVFEDQDMQ